ncbi:MAG TPA: tyrosine-type recombinase/integrase, partial [Caulobacter sp.]|nr:tyrosine-type recombinase/integrase [Caulobacter sp.]
RKARLVVADFERLFMAGEGIVAPPTVHQPIAVIAPVSPAPKVEVAAPRKTFREVFDLFLSDPSRDRTQKTASIYEGLFNVVSGIWGADIALDDIDRARCRDLLDVLRTLPSNPTKRFPKLTMVEASRMAKETGLTSVLSAGSINGYMAKLRTLLTFAVQEGWIERNVAKGLGVIDPIRRRDKRLPFAMEQLRLIFDAPLYRGCIDDGAGYATPGPSRPRRGRFWIPLIALYTGMRLNEICQLDVADIQIVEGVDCIFVGLGPSTEASDKRLKTASSERYIPIHPALHDLGLMDFVAKQRRAGRRKLFSDLPASSTGYYSDKFSRWFSRFTEKAGAARPRTCFHSFRHCYRDALREAGIPHEVALALGGWASAGGKGDVEIAAAYGRGYRLSTLLQAVEKVEFPGLDLRHLRPSNRPPSGALSPDLSFEAAGDSDSDVVDRATDDQAGRVSPLTTG